MKLKNILLIAIIILTFSDIVSATTCIGCATGTYTETHNNNQTNSTNFTIGQTLNGSVFTSSTISIVDAKSNISGIYGSVDKTNLIGYWHFDETTGRLIQDFSSKNNNGTLGEANINSSIAKYNTGVVFNGVTDFARVYNSTDGIRFGLINDIHHTNYVNTYPNIGDNSQRIKNFINSSKSNNSDFAIFIGDMVHDNKDPIETQLNSNELINNLNTFYNNATLYNFSMPIYFVLGNHDVRASNKSVVNNLSMPSNYYYFDIRNWRMIILDAQYNLDGTNKSSIDVDYSEGYIPQIELNWLNSTLDDANNNSKNVIVFVHQNPTISGIYGINNSNTITNIIEFLHPNLVKSVLYGHSHSNEYLFQNNVIYSSDYSPIGNASDISPYDDYSLDYINSNGNLFKNSSGYVSIYGKLKTGLYNSSSAYISAWINLKSAPLATTPIYYEETSMPGFTRFGMYITNTKTLTCGGRDSENGAFKSSTSSSVINLGEWVFVSCSWDSVNDKISGHINTEQFNSSIVISSFTSTLSGSISFANQLSSTNIHESTYLNITIDEMHLYNRNLNEEEIRQSYLVGVQQLQTKYTTNSTYSSNLNGTSSVSVPYLFGESYSALQWLVPNNITDSTGVTCYNCSQQMQFIPSFTITGVENTTNISITNISGNQIINYSWTPLNSYNTSWINFTVPNIGASGYGVAILDNTTNRVLNDNYPSFNISQISVSAGQTYYYNITKPYSDLNLFGTITNEAGQVVEGVSIIVSGITVGTSGADGSYITSTAFLHNSSYSVTYSKIGYNSQTIVVTFNLANVNQNVVLQRQTIQMKLDTCSGIRNYSDIAIPLFGLALMILGFGVILIQLNGKSNPYIILTSLMIIIIGFSTLLIGSYIIYNFYGIVC